MFSNSVSGSVIYSEVFKQLADTLGKDTLIPVQSLDEQGKVKLLHLVVKKKKRKFFFWTKYSYHPTAFQLAEVLDDNAKIPKRQTEDDVAKECEFEFTSSWKANAVDVLRSLIKGVGLEASKIWKTKVKLGRLNKSKVTITQLMEILTVRKLDLQNTFIKQVRKDKNNVLCVVTGVLHSTEDGHIIMETASNAKAGASENSGAFNTEHNQKLVLRSGRALAYNVNELEIERDRSVTMIVVPGSHGGFHESLDAGVTYKKDSCCLQC